MNQDLDQMYRTYSRKVYLYLLSLSQNPALSEDLMQETFLKAALKIDTFQGNSSLSSWLCSIAKICTAMLCGGRRIMFHWQKKCSPSIRNKGICAFLDACMSFLNRTGKSCI
ncbi:RNA polymerase sigma factor [Allobaculum sp. Allo2]|uniref:RNA polymerase sigma factor n=1 Tax=Allobaculum sp. Allo2 TaxID=2853432 RepID=UPI001F60C2CB|nr:sigma factor [Allobaculum sp. Allo2]UNT92385.1 hypothetical protein KWG61_09340 [Allobaculum sp. Allo2]